MKQEKTSAFSSFQHHRVFVLKDKMPVPAKATSQSKTRLNSRKQNLNNKMTAETVHPLHYDNCVFMSPPSGGHSPKKNADEGGFARQQGWKLQQIVQWRKRRWFGFPLLSTVVMHAPSSTYPSHTNKRVCRHSGGCHMFSSSLTLCNGNFINQQQCHLIAMSWRTSPWLIFQATFWKKVKSGDPSTSPKGKRRLAVAFQRDIFKALAYEKLIS